MVCGKIKVKNYVSAHHACSSFSRRLCVLRMPHDSPPRASGDHARSSSSRSLCVLPLPYERGQQRPHAQQLLQEALCSAPAARQPSAG